MLKRALFLFLISFIHQSMHGMSRFAAANRMTISMLPYYVDKQDLDNIIEEQELLRPPFDGGICDDTSLKAPSSYLKIIPGKTPGFDHVKFARLKAKYLDGVNQEYEKGLKRLGWDKTALETAISCKLKQSPRPKNKKLEPLDFRALEALEIDAKTYRFVIDKLQKYGIDAKDVCIRKMPATGSVFMSAACDVDSPHRSSLIFYHNDHVFKIRHDCILKRKSVAISEIQLYDFSIKHEIAHLLHEDPLSEIIFNDGGNDIRNDIREKRADIFAVFNSVNPIALALFFHGNAADKPYAHRSSSEWQDIRSCYSDEIQAQWHLKWWEKILYDAYEAPQLFPKIEHIEE